MSGGNRGINMKSEREVIGLIRSLEDQGARVEWSNAGRRATFPAKVYPPDPSKHFILFHGSVSDSNAATMKRNEIRRAGLHWPGDDGVSAKHLRKAGTAGMIHPTTEAPMSSTNPTPADRKAGEHLVTPPGVNARPKPSRSTVESFRPVLDLLPAVFWTDTVADAIRTLNIGGYAKGTDSNRIQLMLDWFGYRVVSTRPNRSGLSYQWAREGTERQDVSVRGGSPTLRALPPIEEATTVASAEPVAEAPLPPDAGPIAAAFAEAERRKQERLAQHGKAKAKAKTERDGEEPKPAPAGFEVFGKAKGITVDAEPELLAARSAIEGSEARAADDGEQRDEAAEWRALIEEAEAETTRVREELRAMIEDRDAERERGNRQADLLTRRRDEVERLTAEHASLERVHQSYRADIQAREQEVVGLRAELAEAVGRLAERTGDDGSWIVDLGLVEMQYVNALVADAKRLGVTLEIRARHA